MLGLSLLIKLRKFYLRFIFVEGLLFGLYNLVLLEFLEVRMCYKVMCLLGFDFLINLKEFNVLVIFVYYLDGVENLVDL